MDTDGPLSLVIPAVVVAGVTVEAVSISTLRRAEETILIQAFRTAQWTAEMERTATQEPYAPITERIAYRRIVKEIVEIVEHAGKVKHAWTMDCIAYRRITNGTAGTGTIVPKETFVPVTVIAFPGRTSVTAAIT